MRVAVCPGLRLVHWSERGVVVEHPGTGACYSLDAPVGDLLRVLAEPVAWEELAEPTGPLDPALINHLMGAGLLVDPDAPLAGAGLLRCADPTFIGCPQGEVGGGAVTIIGVPTDALSDTGGGAAEGPAALRLASTPPRFQVDWQTGQPSGWYDYGAGRKACVGTTFVDGGDIRVEPGQPPTEPGQGLAHIVAACLRAGSMPLVLGGDHSLTPWAVRGLSDALDGPLAVLHLDAHSDLATPPPRTPTSGSMARALLDLPAVDVLLTVGMRGFCPDEEPVVRAGHRIVSVAEAGRLGPHGIVSLLPQEIPVYVTLDTDVLDPSVAPATNMLLPGGLSFEAVRALLDAVGRERRVVGLDVVELNPSRDPHLATARTMAHLALSLIGACFAADAPDPAGSS